MRRILPRLPLLRESFRRRYNIAPTATSQQAKGIVDLLRYRASRDNRPSTLRIKLTAFIEHRRTNKFMFKVAHSLSPAMLSALAAHFNELNPKPLGGAPKDLAPAGKEIFEEGIPETNVPACSVCHGPEAKGKGPIPRLAGQIYPYIIKVLTNWDKERGQDAANPDISAIMKPIAHNLNASQISAVAAYLSSLN